MSARELWTLYERARSRAVAAVSVLGEPQASSAERLHRASEAFDLVEAAFLTRLMAEGATRNVEQWQRHGLLSDGVDGPVSRQTRELLGGMS